MLQNTINEAILTLMCHSVENTLNEATLTLMCHCVAKKHLMKQLLHQCATVLQNTLNVAILTLMCHCDAKCTKGSNSYTDVLL